MLNNHLKVEVDVEVRRADGTIVPVEAESTEENED